MTALALHVVSRRCERTVCCAQHAVVDVLFMTDKNIPTATVRSSGAPLLLHLVSCRGTKLSYFQAVLLLQMNDSGVEASWNVMAHAQKPYFVFRRNGRVHLNRRGRQFSRLLAAEVCASAVVMLVTPCSEVVWRVLATHSIRQFPLHFPSRASPCAITLQLESTTTSTTAATTTTTTTTTSNTTTPTGLRALSQCLLTTEHDAAEDSSDLSYGINIGGANKFGPLDTANLASFEAVTTVLWYSTLFRWAISSLRFKGSWHRHLRGQAVREKYS